MKKRITYAAVCAAVCAGTVLAVLAGCQNIAAGPDTQLLSFAFKKSVNTFLSADINGVIDHAARTVTVTVPESAYEDAALAQTGSKQFKASFTVSPKTKLYKGSTAQTSGVVKDLFIKNREYRVVADEDGSSALYTVCVKIAYNTPSIPPAEEEAVKQLYGTYYGKLHFDNNYYDIRVVVDKEKLINYSVPMSARYTNMQWSKRSATEWECKAYQKEDFTRSKPERTTLTFKVTDGQPTCKVVVNAMGNAPSAHPDAVPANPTSPPANNYMPKGADYVFSPYDGTGFKSPNEP